MRKTIVLIIVIALIGINVFSQSKKKQIELLNYKIDSLTLVLNNEKQKNNILASELTTSKKTLLEYKENLLTCNNRLKELEEANKLLSQANSKNDNSLLNQKSIKKIDSILSAQPIILYVTLEYAGCGDLCHYEFKDDYSGQIVELEWNSKLDKQSSSIIDLIENCANFEQNCTMVLKKQYSVICRMRIKEEEIVTGYYSEGPMIEKTGQLKVYYEILKIRYR